MPAFIFDMDGVIIDSNPLHRLAWMQYTRLHGVEMTEAMQQTMYGKRNDEIIRGYLGEQLTDDEVFAHGAAKEALYREMMGPCIAKALVPGVREFLERHRGIPMGVATNAEAANVDFVLDGAGLRSFFRAIIDGHQVDRPKPYPDIFLAAARALGTLPADCIVFEDSHAGVAAGVAAGMPVVGLTTTHANLSGPALLIPDFLDPTLEDWLVARNQYSRPHP